MPAADRSLGAQAVLAEGAATPVIDLRDPAAFAARHVVGATHIPLEELATRMFELPAPFV